MAIANIFRGPKHRYFVKNYSYTKINKRNVLLGTMLICGGLLTFRALLGGFRNTRPGEVFGEFGSYMEQMVRLNKPKANSIRAVFGEDKVRTELQLIAESFLDRQLANNVNNLATEAEMKETAGRQAMAVGRYLAQQEGYAVTMDDFLRMDTDLTLANELAEIEVKYLEAPSLARHTKNFFGTANRNQAKELKDEYTRKDIAGNEISDEFASDKKPWSPNVPGDATLYDFEQPNFILNFAAEIAEIVEMQVFDAEETEVSNNNDSPQIIAATTPQATSQIKEMVTSVITRTRAKASSTILTISQAFWDPATSAPAMAMA